MRWTRTVGLGLVLVVGMLGTACSGSDGGSSSGGGGASGDTVRLTIKDFSFQPGTIEGSAGQTLTIEVSNQDSTEHSFTLDDDSVSQDFEGGDGGTVQVTLPDSGTVGWHCEYHPDTMQGTIEVV